MEGTDTSSKPKQLRCEPNANGAEGTLPQDSKWERIEGQGKFHFQCKLCKNEKHIKIWSIRDHIHHKHENKLYDCPGPGCSSRFGRRDLRQRHVKAKHPNYLADLNKGDPDGYGSKDEDEFIERINGKGSGFFRCKFEKCNVSKARKNPSLSLERDHVRTVHMGQEMRCSDCGKSYTSSEALKNHMNIHHTFRTDIFYQCECGEEFMNITEFKRHTEAKRLTDFRRRHNLVSRDKKIGRDILVSAFAEDTKILTEENVTKYVWELQHGDIIKSGGGEHVQVLEVRCHQAVPSNIVQVTDHKDTTRESTSVSSNNDTEAVVSSSTNSLNLDLVEDEDMDEESLIEKFALNTNDGEFEAETGENPLCRLSFRGTVAKVPGVAADEKWSAKLDICELDGRTDNGWFRNLCGKRGIYGDLVNDAAWILGLWIGDGMWNKLSIACDKNHTGQIQKISEVGNRLGLQVKASNLYVKRPGFLKKVHVAINVTLFPPEHGNGGNYLLRLIYESGGCGLSGATRKRFPPELVYDEQAILEYVLAGLIDSDGHVLVDQWHKNSYSVAITTIYPQVKNALVDAGRSLGLGTSVVQRDPRNNSFFGVNARSKRYYDVRYTGTALARILSKSGLEHKYRKCPEVIPKKRRRHIFNLIPPASQLQETMYELVLIKGERVMISNGVVVHLAKTDGSDYVITDVQVNELRNRMSKLEVANQEAQREEERRYYSSASDWKKQQLSWIKKVLSGNEASQFHPHFSRAQAHPSSQGFTSILGNRQMQVATPATKRLRYT